MCLGEWPSHFLSTTRRSTDCLCLVYLSGDLLSEWESSHGLSWDEAWLYQTTITLHLHSICTLLFSSISESVCVPLCVCVLLVITFLVWGCRHAQQRKSMQRKKKDETRIGRGRSIHMIQPLHLMQVPFAPYCLFHCWKKSRWFTKPGEAADPFSYGTVALCVYLCLSSMCKFPQNIRSDNHSFCLCATTHLWEWIAAVFPYKKFIIIVEFWSKCFIAMSL